jgi:hypothetical protein
MEASADLTSVGRPEYHAGVLPAAMDDAISEAKAAWLVAAAARADGGSAVARARSADCCLCNVRHALVAYSTHRQWRACELQWRRTQGRGW